MSTVDHNYQRVKRYHRSTTPIYPDGCCLRMSAPCFIASKTNFLTGLDPNQGTQPAIFVAAHSSYLSCEPKQKKILWLKNYHIRKKSVFLLPSSSVTLTCPDVVRMLCFLSLGGWTGGSCQLGRSASAGSCQIGRSASAGSCQTVFFRTLKKRGGCD